MGYTFDPMATLKLLHGSEGYSLDVDGEISEESEYGQPLEFTAGGKTYVAFVDLDEDGAPTTPLASLVYCGEPVEAEEIEAGEDAEEQESAEG